MKTTSQLKNILQRNNLDFFLEAYNALSATIVEEAGFAGVWASGLSISASCGVRDRNEISWTEVLKIVERMCDRVSIPVLMDGDSGYGDFNNVRLLVKKSEQYGVAGLCLEDKNFPKTNSFLTSKSQWLVSPEEFCGKIKAGKDSQRDSDYCLIARTESLIFGRSMQETLDRAHAYAQAGADAVLVHSKISTSDQIEAFMRQWSNDVPIVIVPTKYAQTPTSVFESLNISLVIWANHILRASITNMQKVAHSIFHQQSVSHLATDIASLNEVFRLQNVQELEQAEATYLS